jgi:hypothetical protein
MKSCEGSNGRRRRLPKNGSVSTLRDSRRVSGQAFGQFRGEVMGFRMEETIVKVRTKWNRKFPYAWIINEQLLLRRCRKKECNIFGRQGTV